MDKGASATPTGLAGAEAPEPPSRLGPADGIPSARIMQMQWSTDAGPVLFQFPSNLSHDDVSDVSELLDLTLSGMWRRAQAIEARRAETQSGSVVDESAVRDSECAQPSDISGQS